MPSGGYGVLKVARPAGNRTCWSLASLKPFRPSSSCSPDGWNCGMIGDVSAEAGGVFEKVYFVGSPPSCSSSCRPSACAGSWRFICLLRGRRAPHRESHFPCFFLLDWYLLARPLSVLPLCSSSCCHGLRFARRFGCLRVEGLQQRDGLARVFALARIFGTRVVLVLGENY